MAVQSQGTKLFWNTGTTVWSTVTGLIGQVISFNGPTGSAAVIDITTLGSTAKEKLMGLPDEGQVSMELALITTDTAQIALRNDRAAKTRSGCVIKLNDAPLEANKTRVKFAAYITGFSIAGAVDDKVKASVTMEIDGPCSWSTA